MLDLSVRVIVTRQLSKKEYIWLHCLSDKIGKDFPLEDLGEAYKKHKDEEEYQNYMNQFIRANLAEGKEREAMCEALYELFADQLVEREQIGERRGDRAGGEGCEISKGVVEAVSIIEIFARTSFLLV